MTDWPYDKISSMVSVDPDVRLYLADHRPTAKKFAKFWKGTYKETLIGLFIITIPL